MSAWLIRKLEGDFENILVREVETRVAAHIQIPVGDRARRVVVAMPAGKAALCFETAAPAGWSLASEVSPFAENDGQGGVAFTLESPAPEIAIPVSSILLNHTLMARFGVDPEYKNEARLRDLFQSGGIPALESRLEMSLQDLSDRGVTLGPLVDTPAGKIAFTRRSWDGKHRYRLEFIGGPATGVRAADGILHVSRRDPASADPLRLAIRASTDFVRPTPLPLAELVNERGHELQRKDPFLAQALRNFEFLSFREKFLAGSWNFLSYFGRDTLIALRLMWPVLSPRAKQTGIQSVANEIAEGGVVNVTDEWTDDRAAVNAIECFLREIDKDNLPGARRIMETILAGTVPEHPFLDVLDQTFMYPSAAAHWFAELDAGELKKWLLEEHLVLGRAESNLATLLRNWNYILAAAAPYAEAWRDLRARHPGLAPRQLVAAHPDEFRATCETLVHSIAGAANWRDTYNLPWHFRPEDINANLLPMAIAAIQDMVARIGPLGLGPELAALAKRLSLDVVGGYLEAPARFAAAREAWDRDLMRAHFLVRRSADEMRRDLARYMAGLENGEAFFGDRDRGVRERDALLRCREDGVSVAEFLRGSRTPPSVAEGIEFTALLLDPDGERLPLMQSDDVYGLLFGAPSLDQYKQIVRPLLLAYPFGLGFLDDDIGIAVTSAVYSPRDNPALKDGGKNVWVKFGPDEYHGRAAWPWVLFAWIAGTHRQAMQGIDDAGRLADGVAPEDVALFRYILAKAKSSIAKLGPLATSEVYKYAPADASQGVWQAEPMGISTPIQLWSAAPANLLIDEALERIARVRPR